MARQRRQGVGLSPEGIVARAQYQRARREARRAEVALPVAPGTFPVGTRVRGRVGAKRDLSGMVVGWRGSNVTLTWDGPGSDSFPASHGGLAHDDPDQAAQLGAEPRPALPPPAPRPLNPTDRVSSAPLQGMSVPGEGMWP
jgi:hypothetical protein